MKGVDNAYIYLLPSSSLSSSLFTMVQPALLSMIMPEANDTQLKAPTLKEFVQVAPVSENVFESVYCCEKMGNVSDIA